MANSSRLQLLNLVCLGLLVFATNLQAHDAETASDTKTSIGKCAKFSSSSARLECYDQLATRLLAVTIETHATTKPAQSAPPLAVAETGQEKAALPQDIGGTQFGQEAKEEQPETYRGTITSCKKGGDGKHLFIFDNGQVWKQVKSNKRRYKNCNFEVTITEDIFGYKMAIDGQKRSIRINRKR